tara:strand:- start:21 stop:263 length:243 start_codon:yes stop_codon:yes gene_type:complete
MKEKKKEKNKLILYIRHAKTNLFSIIIFSIQIGVAKRQFALNSLNLFNPKYIRGAHKEIERELQYINEMGLRELHCQRAI